MQFTLCVRTFVSVLHSIFHITYICIISFFFFQAEDGIRDLTVTGVQTCALPIYRESICCRHPTTRIAPKCRPRTRFGPFCILSSSITPTWSSTRAPPLRRAPSLRDRKSTRLNSSHSQISYAAFCLKKKQTRGPHRHAIGDDAIGQLPSPQLSHASSRATCAASRRCYEGAPVRSTPR